MDELTKLRSFRASVTPRVGARTRAEQVLRQATAGGRRRPRVARPLALAAAVAALLVAGGAYALERYVLVGDPAPPDVKEIAARLNEVRGSFLRERHPGPRPLVEDMRAGAVIRASAGPVYMWVAPSSDGGYCAFLDLGLRLPDGRPNMSSGCHSGDARLLDPQSSGMRMPDGRWLQLLHGSVRRPPVERLELVRPGADPVEIPLSGRFFLYQVEDMEPEELPPLAVVAYDSSGRVVARRTMHYPRPRFRRLDISGQRPLIEILTRRTKKPIKLYVLEREGELCSVVDMPAGRSGSCTRSPKPSEIGVSYEQIGPSTSPKAMLLLHGQVGEAIDALDLVFEDGRTEHLPLVDGWTLYQVSPTDLVPGRLPSEFVGRDEGGKVIARRPVAP